MDANTDNAYQVTVKATADGKSDTLAVTVRVTNVDEAPAVSGSTTLDFAENNFVAARLRKDSPPSDTNRSYSVGARSGGRSAPW